MKIFLCSAQPTTNAPPIPSARRVDQHDQHQHRDIDDDHHHHHIDSRRPSSTLNQFLPWKQRDLFSWGTLSYLTFSLFFGRTNRNGGEQTASGWNKRVPNVVCHLSDTPIPTPTTTLLWRDAKPIYFFVNIVLPISFQHEANRGQPNRGLFSQASDQR